MNLLARELAKKLADREAAIRRVRKEVGTWPVSLDKTVAACADSVLRALDGERLNPIRDIIDPPKPECCTDGTCDECAPLFEWAEYRKDYEPNATVEAFKAFRAGWDAARKEKEKEKEEENG